MTAPRKSVLITGCSEGGIGASLAETFRAKGYHVFVTARNPSKMPQALATAAHVTPVTLDVLSAESITAAVKTVERTTGGTLDVLVNNAGNSIAMPALDTSIEEGKRLFDLNFWAPVAMLQAFAPLLIKAKGCVVNNTSANAHVPFPFLSLYNGSKAALAATSETWRLELKPLGVRTITIITYAVKTKGWDGYSGPDLPSSSPYYPVRHVLDTIRSGSLQENANPASQYAAKVVSEVEKGTSGMIWAGTGASFNRWMTWLSPQWLMDMVLENMVPLSGEMAKAAKEK